MFLAFLLVDSTRFEHRVFSDLLKVVREDNTFVCQRVCDGASDCICMWVPPEGELQLLCMLNVGDIRVSMFVYVIICR